MNPVLNIQVQFGSTKTALFNNFKKKKFKRLQIVLKKTNEG